MFTLLRLDGQVGSEGVKAITGSLLGWVGSRVCVRDMSGNSES